MLCPCSRTRAHKLAVGKTSTEPSSSFTTKVCISRTSSRYPLAPSFFSKRRSVTIAISSPSFQNGTVPGGNDEFVGLHKMLACDLRVGGEVATNACAHQPKTARSPKGDNDDGDGPPDRPRIIVLRRSRCGGAPERLLRLLRRWKTAPARLRSRSGPLPAPHRAATTAADAASTNAGP